MLHAVRNLSGYSYENEFFYFVVIPGKRIRKECRNLSIFVYIMLKSRKNNK